MRRSPEKISEEIVIGIGAALPEITLKDDTGADVELTKLERPFVLWFFPKADTPGCTSEGTQFTELYDAFKQRGVEIVGVSRDSVESQRAFKEKFGFPFRLLADTESKLSNAFGVLVERERDGQKTIGIARTTFLIDADGKIARVWPNVDVAGHAQDVLSAV
jgi:peroxiredoxin Q/BCP